MLSELDLKAKNYALVSILEDRDLEIKNLKTYISQLESKLPFNEIRDKGKQIYEDKIRALEEKLYSGLDAIDFEDWEKTGPKALSYYVDSLCAAYCKKTNINPLHSKLICCVPEDGKSIQYYFAPKTGQEVPVEVHSPI